MTNSTTKEQAIKVLQILTAIHGPESYFLAADVIYSDGFHCVDMKVDGAKWRANKPVTPVPPQIDRVPICVMMYG